MVKEHEVSNYPDQITDCLTSNTGKIHVILMPRKLLSIEKLFEEEGLAGVVELHQFSWEFIPLDYDLLSLELPSMTSQACQP